MNSLLKPPPSLSSFAFWFHSIIVIIPQKCLHPQTANSYKNTLACWPNFGFPKNNLLGIRKLQQHDYVELTLPWVGPGTVDTTDWPFSWSPSDFFSSDAMFLFSPSKTRDKKCPRYKYGQPATLVCQINIKVCTTSSCEESQKWKHIEEERVTIVWGCVYEK